MTEPRPSATAEEVAAALRYAGKLGLDVDGRVADAERIPYDDATFDLPAELEEHASRAGAAQVRVVTEELTPAMQGWPVRTFEAAVPPLKLGLRWAMFAHRGWQRLSWLDRTVIARVVPRAWFHNALVTGTRP